MVALGSSQNFPVSLPYKGMDLQTPIAAMDPGHAPYISNYFLDGQSLNVRYGQRNYSKVPVASGAISSDAVFRLANYAKSDGTLQLIGFSYVGGFRKMVDFSSNPASAMTGALTLGVSTNFISFRNRLYAFDGIQGSQVYDGSTWSGPVGFTGLSGGIASPIDQIITGSPYRSRLYLVQDKTTFVWYGDVDAISGALTKFDLGSVFQNGGYLHYVASINYGDSNVADSYLCFISSEGEVLVYTGSYPESPDWSIVSRFKIGKPLSRKGYLYFQGDTLICTSIGLSSLRDLIGYSRSIRSILSNVQSGQLYKTYSNAVDPLWRLLVRAGGGTVASISFFSATGCIYVVLNGTLSRLYNNFDPSTLNAGNTVFVYNTINQSWSLYDWSSQGVQDIIEYNGKLVTARNSYTQVFEVEKVGIYNDEIDSAPGTYQQIDATYLSPAFSSTRDSGTSSKFNALSLHCYINSGGLTTPAYVYLLENFGKTTANPAGVNKYVDNGFNNLIFGAGASAEYVQYQLTMSTNSTSGYRTVLYQLGALIQPGGFR